MCKRLRRLVIVVVAAAAVDGAVVVVVVLDGKHHRAFRPISLSLPQQTETRQARQGQQTRDNSARDRRYRSA